MYDIQYHTCLSESSKKLETRGGLNEASIISWQLWVSYQDM
jgi:hypothetical protein